MSAALSWPLHQAVYGRLSADAGLTGLMGAGRIYDAPPHADGPSSPQTPYVVMGDETATIWDSQTHRGAEHRLSFDIWSRERGFAQAKQILGALSDALHDVSLTLSRGRVVLIRFESAETLREEQATLRRIRAVFRAVVEE